MYEQFLYVQAHDGGSSAPIASRIPWPGSILLGVEVELGIRLPAHKSPSANSVGKFLSLPPHSRPTVPSAEGLNNVSLSAKTTAPSPTDRGAPQSRHFPRLATSRPPPAMPPPPSPAPPPPTQSHSCNPSYLPSTPHHSKSSEPPCTCPRLQLSDHPNDLRAWNAA